MLANMKSAVNSYARVHDDKGNNSKAREIRNWIFGLFKSNVSDTNTLCCSYSIPSHTPGKGYINPKKLTKFFKKYTPLPPVITFEKMGFKKIVQLMNIWMSLL